jgi:hypothetical protein
MKSVFVGLLIFLSSTLANATVQEGQIYFVPVDSAKYQLGTGKSATAEFQVGFISKLDAESASQNSAKVKAVVEAAMKESKLDVTTKRGKMLLGTEVATKLQDSGINAQTILWNSFLM